MKTFTAPQNPGVPGVAPASGAPQARRNYCQPCPEKGQRLMTFTLLFALLFTAAIAGYFLFTIVERLKH